MPGHGTRKGVGGGDTRESEGRRIKKRGCGEKGGERTWNCGGGEGK